MRTNNENPIVDENRYLYSVGANVAFTDYQNLRIEANEKRVSMAELVRQKLGFSRNTQTQNEN